MKNIRVFVSGGAGVIGRELVKKLVNKGAIVMVGDLVSIPEDFPEGVIYRRGDLNYITQKELDVFNPEIFFHLAATFERSEETYEHWEENFWHNIRLSNYLMTLMRNVPALKRVVYSSSYLIYDKELYSFNKPQKKPVKLKESDPIFPRNLTGMAKLAHEIELDFLSKFKSEKFTSVCARIYRGYGKNSRDVISRWVRDLLTDKSISVYNPEGWFDYMYAEDTAEGLIRLSQIDYAGIVNLGTGRSRRVSHIVDVLEKHFPGMNYNVETSSLRYEASEADVTKLKSLINWLPNRDLENTIPEIIEYEKNHKAIEKRNKNVLITSVSKKIPLIEAVKKGVKKINTDIKIIGGDSNDKCLGKYFVDLFWKMPNLNDLTIENLKEFCFKNNIGLIIPTRDGELEYFANLKSQLREVGIEIMVSNKRSVINCLDKLMFSKIPNINAIPASENIDDIDSESFVVKERYGAGSISIGLNLTKEQAIHHKDSLDFPIFQPFIRGQEISVDAYVTHEKEVKGVILRKRDVVVNGESQITSTFRNSELENTFKRIIKSLNLYGHIILQALIDDKGEIHVIECNPRFGGASTLSLRAGLDSFYWCYLESQGYTIKSYPFLPSDTKIVQIRHPQDFYL